MPVLHHVRGLHYVRAPSCTCSIMSVLHHVRASSWQCSTTAYAVTSVVNCHNVYSCSITNTYFAAAAATNTAAVAVKDRHSSVLWNAFSVCDVWQFVGYPVSAASSTQSYAITLIKPMVKHSPKLSEQNKTDQAVDNTKESYKKMAPLQSLSGTSADHLNTTKKIHRNLYSFYLNEIQM